MASLSAYERYSKHAYVFPWSDRHKWAALLERFHSHGATWTITRDTGPPFAVQIEDATILADEEDRIVARAAPKPKTKVNVRTSGNAFWGAMPTAANINWDALPANPPGDMPAAVVAFCERAVRQANVVGCFHDAAFIYKPLPETIDAAWFPAVVRALRAAPGFACTTLFYAPSVPAMYVQVTDADDHRMIVRFNCAGVEKAADETFDLDDNFGQSAPSEMHHDYVAWCTETDLDPAAELLKLRAPYDVMWKPPAAPAPPSSDTAQ